MGLAALLKEGLAAGGRVSMRVQDGEGRTPLNIAVASGSVETVKVRRRRGGGMGRGFERLCAL